MNKIACLCRTPERIIFEFDTPFGGVGFHQSGHDLSSVMGTLVMHFDTPEQVEQYTRAGIIIRILSEQERDAAVKVAKDGQNFGNKLKN